MTRKQEIKKASKKIARRFIDSIEWDSDARKVHQQDWGVTDA